MWIEQGVTAFAIWANGSQSFPRALARLRANAPPRFLNAFVLVFFFSQLTYFLSFFFFTVNRSIDFFVFPECLSSYVLDRQRTFVDPNLCNAASYRNLIA